MKKSKIFGWGLIMLAPTLIALASCNKYLDRKPLTATADAGLESSTLNMYVTLRTYAGLATLPWLDFNSIRDDDAQKGSSTTDGAEINAEFETFQYTKDDWATNTYWNDHFFLINQANKVIHNADSFKVTDAASLRNVGEAHFFRAYAYFNLVKAYGEVPLIDYYYTNAPDGIRAKSPVTDIYALIDRDLDSAGKLLPVNWFNSTINANPFPGRLTVGAANTLWAQTYLFRQQWDKVVSLCNVVKNSNQYGLLPNFTDVWKDGVAGAGKNSQESIFEMQATVGTNGTNSYGSDWGTCQQVRIADGYSDRTWNLGWGWNTPTTSLVNNWDATDPRKAATILYSGQSDGGTATGGYGATLPAYVPGNAAEQPYWNKKVYGDPAQRQATGHTTDGNASWINHRIIRYADVILMLAEASNELGDGATAETNLELVRARARGGNTTVLPHIAYTSQAQMRTAIKNERRYEFAMEGYRFYDLVRWGDASSVLGGLGYTDRCKYYPIPQKAIDLSGGKLVQNPQW